MNSPSDLPSSDSDGSSKGSFGLPEGTIQVGAALLIAGICSYLFLGLGETAMGSEAAFRPIQALWFAVFALAPGFFLPLEQELGRALSARRARHEGGRPVARRVAVIGVIVAVSLIASVAVLSKLLAEHYFHGDWWMVLSLAVAFAAYAPAHIARGISAGSGRFTSYAIVISSDGVIRLGLLLIFMLVGVRASGAYGLGIALAPLLGLGYVIRKGWLHTDDGPPAPWAEVNQNLGWLLLGSVAAAVLLNAGYVTVNTLAPEGQDGLVVAFGYGLILARVPLFLFQAVQAALLPRLSRLATRGEFTEFRQGLRTLLMIVAGVGVVGVIGAYVVGPPMLRLVWHTELPGRTLAMLGVSSALYMLALATGQAIIALNGHRIVGLGWTVAVAMFGLSTWLASQDLVTRVEVGLVVSSGSALGIFLYSLQRRLAQGVHMTPANVWEAITDLPVEGP